MSLIPGFKRGLPAILACILLATSLYSGIASAQQGGIGVDNDGPSFIDISVSEDQTYKFVRVELRDLNGWNDIFSINVTVFDAEDRALSQVRYMLYPNLNETAVVVMDWVETSGSYFVEAASGWASFEVAPWYVPENAIMNIGLRVTFAFQKFSGERISIQAMDVGELTCMYTGPFSADYTPAPVWEDVVVPIGLSTSVAATAALLLVYRRFKNNKLARAVEANHTGSGEE